MEKRRWEASDIERDVCEVGGGGDGKEVVEEEERERRWMVGERERERRVGVVR